MHGVSTSEILNSFCVKPKNHFERMAIFSNDYMVNYANEMISNLQKFIETLEYSEYLKVASDFENLKKYMNARDAFITHNPDRSGAY